MPRPQGCRRISHHPRWRNFHPQGPRGCRRLRGRDNTVVLNKEELEALRLKYVLEMDQTKAAKKMATSQSTFQRILSRANKKTALALVRGKTLIVE
ncbi:MAG: DUF134 domain-containing protein [bacterium]